ncbi:MAG: DUF302 domain-containing protein [Agarilytica sp.]
MNHLTKIVLLSVLQLSVYAAAAAPYKTIGPARVFETPGTFAETKENLILAIENEGMVISYTSHASKMLARTAKAAGVTTAVYNDAEIVFFCKAELSHALVQANPHNLVLCPYSIAIYTLTNEKNRVYLSIRDPYSKEPHLDPITQMVLNIIKTTQNGF